MDKTGRVFASWISGTFICGSGECIYVAQNGFDSAYEQETELVVENGVVVSSRTYTNKTYGTVYLREVSYNISSEFELSKIKAPKGRVTVKIDALKFSNEGKVTEWSVDFLSGYDNLATEIKEMIIKEVNRVFSLFDWKTYNRDGEWHWLTRDGVTYPLILLVQDSKIVVGGAARDPRTAIGYTSGNFVWMFTVDGRHKGTEGMTYSEMATIFFALDCKMSVNMDGGGSAEMIARNPKTDKIQVCNWPSDPTEGAGGVERARPNAWAIVKK